MNESVLFLFVDGLGLGPPGPDNPLARTRWEGLEELSGGYPWTSEAPFLADPGHTFRPLDATLGVEGLPQSGTGQAALFSGVNAARTAGRHFGPYPHSSTRDRLARENLFRRVRDLPATGPPRNENPADPRPEPVAFANAYPEIFFERRSETDRWTVTTFCCRAAGVPLRGWSEWRERKALTADLTGRAWREKLGYDLEPITEDEAGRRLAALGRRHTLTVFEYFLTDKAGHGRGDCRPEEVLGSLDRFVAALLESLHFERQTLILASDHGNLEDLGRSTHTRNPVPLAARGPGADRLAEAASILEVTPAITHVLSGATSSG